MKQGGPSFPQSPKEWKRDKVSAPRHEELREKIGQIEQGGIEKLHVVADFDRTLTAGASVHKEMVTNASMGILLLERFMPKAFIEDVLALFKKYYPAEVDPHLPIPEKARLMEEWFGKVFSRIISEGLTRERVADMARSELVTPREGVSTFLSKTRRFGIPTVIFSAGFGDFIVEYMKYHKLYSPTTFIISNFGKYDADGKIAGWNESIIHPFNKNESHTEFSGLSSITKNRPNVLLIGDSASDIHMADGAKHQTILSVGFLNGKESLRENFERQYDLVIGGDSPFRVPNSIIDGVLKRSG